jgi:hypothetical protein
MGGASQTAQELIKPFQMSAIKAFAIVLVAISGAIIAV